MQRVIMTVVAAAAAIGASAIQPTPANADTEFSVTLDSDGGLSASVTERGYDESYAEPVDYYRGPVVVDRRPIVVAPRRFYGPRRYAPPRRYHAPRRFYGPRAGYRARPFYGPRRLGPRGRYWRREALRNRYGY